LQIFFIVPRGYCYQTGSIDDKLGVIGILESIELLLKQKYVPKRTIYICFGHDEEVGFLQR